MTKSTKPVNWPVFVKLIRSEEYGCFSQAELAREMNVHDDAIRKWEYSISIPIQKNRRALFAIAKKVGIEKKDIPRK